MRFKDCRYDADRDKYGLCAAGLGKCERTCVFYTKHTQNKGYTSEAKRKQLDISGDYGDQPCRCTIETAGDCKNIKWCLLQTAENMSREIEHLNEELKITRDYIHEKGLEWELLSKCIRRK